jgi:hypothetical protein
MDMPADNSQQSLISAAEFKKMTPRKKSMKREEKLQSWLCRWLRIKYPTAMFMADIAAGMNLGKKWNGIKSAWRTCKGMPDLYIFEPRGEFYGLFLELKADTPSSSPVKINGTLKGDKHIQEQFSVHIIMKNKGYLCLFVTGREHATDTIQWYLAGCVGEPPKYVRKRKPFID